MLLYSILIVYVGYGSHVLALLLVHAVMVYVVALTRKPILVWIVVVLQITSFSVQSLLDFQVSTQLCNTFVKQDCVIGGVLWRAF